LDRLKKNMDRFKIAKGVKVIFDNKEAIIIRIINIETVTIEEISTGIPHTVEIKKLHPPQKGIDYNNHNIVSISDKDWEKASKRYEVIKPALEKKGDLITIKNISKKHKVSVPTIYRWIKLFNESGLVSSLAGRKKTGGIGKSRISNVINDIVKSKIESVYLNSSKHSIKKTIRAIENTCKELNLKPPHSNTIRNRIKDISDEERIRKRIGYQEAKYKYEPLKGHFPGADHPLAVVQIDHTPVDIILVDEQNREPYKRPWLTLAMDIYSRVVLGFYLSFEAPGALGTGMCIANSILPKEMWLGRIGVDSNWPCYGIMDCIHLDNAKEFRGKMLKKTCMEYGIDIQFRPIGAPHWGGHIERLLGTFSKEIHDLPGTTFSSKEEKGNYKSEKKSAFSLLEFEEWLAKYITKIYHNRKHSSIQMTPLQKFDEGIMGTSKTPGRGIPDRINNERKVRLDFMPYVERTVQEYGIVIDHIHYYSDVLRYYIHDSEGNSKKKHIFKRDPRDISVVYFLDPLTNDYTEIPYRNTSLPPMSIWEYRDVLKNLKLKKLPINEEIIFETYKDLEELERKAVKRTRTKRRSPELTLKPEKVISKNKIIEIDTNIEPFEDLEDEAFTY